MKALMLNAERKTAYVQDIPKPIPSSHEVLVQVDAIALNPVDALYVFHPLGSTGRVVGSDFAGTIVSLAGFGNIAVPPNCGLQPGTRVGGFCQGACSVNDRPGAFAEFLVCPWDLLFTVPEGMAMEQAATISLCGLTVAQAVYYRLGLKAPFTWKQTGESDSHLQSDGSGADTEFFIYGASTSVALYAAQLVRRSAEVSGTKIGLLGTASPKRFQMLKSLPYLYDKLVDYHDPEWPGKISGSAETCSVQYALDWISEGDSVRKVSQTLREDGKMVVVRSREGGAWKADDLAIEPVYGAVWEGLGEDIQYAGIRVAQSLDARAFAVEFFRWLTNGGKLEPNSVRVMPGGLEKVVVDGLTLLGSSLMEDRKPQKEQGESWMKSVSAEKLVYRIT
ncbi:GroES-like protein [Viridothelium virens]|uniref:GroES-like protein n=1 Tax=Viridothelium virens TaxID=1048519 RepID=A0A6A6GVL8_VIRVR|nr:GroES-like protein [Viridothelium virens]